MRAQAIILQKKVAHPLRAVQAVLLAGIMALAIAYPALADCPRQNTLPAAREGTIGYDRATKCIYVCDGVNWVNQC